MATEESKNITDHFSDLEDPRVDRTKKHNLLEIIVIAICAVISGADEWTEIELWGKAKIDWLKRFLVLEHGIPSHDTFGRVFGRIDPEGFGKCFLSWIQAISRRIRGEVVSIDGKTLRRSRDQYNNKAAIHIVSAWASENRLVLGQVKVDEKSNEITAIPELLQMLEVNGCIVTIDAMGCQKEIAKDIVDKGADYVLALKGNHGGLHEDVELFFQDAVERGFKGIDHEYHSTSDIDHGRFEKREYYLVTDIEWLHEKEEWKGLHGIGMVRAERTVEEETSVEMRYYIGCSLRSVGAIYL